MREISAIRLKTLILSSLVIIFIFVPTVDLINRDNNLGETWEKFGLLNVKSSQTTEKIHINGNNGWLDFKNAGNCTGLGTYSNPYIIKDLVIDGANLGSCILIENSDVYFTIQYCTIFNSGHSGSRDSGIYLKNVTNGKILNNNCSFNKNGIYVYFSKNNTILANIANNNTYHGICVEARTNKTIIDGNIVSFNSYIGIHMDGGYTNHDSYNNLIINNYVSYTSGEGIRITFNKDALVINNTCQNNDSNALNIQICQNVTISKNTFQSSNSEGIYAYWLKSVNFYNNTISSNKHSGLNIEYAKDVNLVDNIFIENSNGINLNGYAYPHEIAGIEHCVISRNHFVDCSTSGILINDVFNLNINYNEFSDCGILISGHASLYNASSHSILNNYVNGKPVHYYVNQTSLEVKNDSNIGQIILVNCNQSSLSNLDISSSSIGISLLYCNNNEISACILNNHFCGLDLASSHYNTISGITTNDNIYGIQIQQSKFNIIKNSDTTSNLNGIILYESINNEITKNIVNYNILYGIILYFSDFNQVKENIINYNDIGIYLFGFEGIKGSNNNSITDNTLIGNDQCIFESEVCTGNLFNNNYCAEGPRISGYNLLSLFCILILISNIIIKKVRKIIKKN